MVEHLNSGKIGFIPRNRVVIDANHQLSKTTLNELPLEMLDIILQNSYLCWTMHSSPNQRDEDIIKALASVNFCWFQKIARRRFKKTVWRRLKEFYEKTKKNSALIRDNREFLLANIQPNGKLFDSLLSRNCITEKQSRFIQRNRSERARNTDLLHVVGTFDMTMMPYFINCLRQTDQKTVARIIENGGGMIKVDVEDRGPMNATSMDTKLIHEAIENLRQRTTPRSHQTEKLMSQLKEEGLEILNSQLDKQAVVVWIWCHSQTAIENIQKLYASNQLTEILFGFANIRPPTSEIFQSKLITIDSSELKKTLVVFRIFINFTDSLYAGVDEVVTGIAKFRNEVYMLCRYSSPSSSAISIRVFEDRNPFRLQSKFQIEDIKFPWNVTFSEKENCLYVADWTEKCVWKILREADNQHKCIKWLTIDNNKSPSSMSSMSMSSDEALLMVYYDLNILDIYGSGAELRRSIQLPSYCTWIFHAVETYSRNFIILYRREKKKAGESGSSERERTEEWGISEVNKDGLTVTRHLFPSNEPEKLNFPTYLSLDSDDRLFVADSNNHRVIIMNSDLTWNRILCQTEEEKTRFYKPLSLSYDTEKRQLFVVQKSDVNVYTLNRK